MIAVRSRTSLLLNTKLWNILKYGTFLNNMTFLTFTFKKNQTFVHKLCFMHTIIFKNCLKLSLDYVYIQSMKHKWILYLDFVPPSPKSLFMYIQDFWNSVNLKSKSLLVPSISDKGCPIWIACYCVTKDQTRHRYKLVLLRQTFIFQY